MDQIPVGSDLPNSNECSNVRDALMYLERLVPDWLSEVYDDWKHESLDGFDFRLARKTDNCEAEFAGLAWLMSQDRVPIHIRLRVSDAANQVTRLQLRICDATRISQAGNRVPAGTATPNRLLKHICAGGEIDDYNWVYKVTFDHT